MDATERFLCLASYEKGHDFLRQCAQMGIGITLLTLDKHRDAAWPRESLEELATMPPGLNREQILNTVSWMARGKRFDRVIALHDVDLETAAQIREHMRVPGMGTTTAGCYRDKLAQRVIAHAFGYRVPEFCRVLNYDELRDYMARVPAPWLLKPRMDAPFAATHTIEKAEQLWRTLDAMGDAQSHYILEQFIHGEVFHVDSIISECNVKFSIAHQNGTRPAQGGRGGIFTAWTVDRKSSDAQELAALNRALAPLFGMVHGVTHAKFLRSRADDHCYFLEVGARVSGASMDQLAEAATGVSLWREWARLEAGNLRHTAYRVPDSFEGFAGSVACTAEGTKPDFDMIADPAIVARFRKEGQAGLIVRAASADQLQRLLEDYSAQIENQLLSASNAGQDMP